MLADVIFIFFNPRLRFASMAAQRGGERRGGEAREGGGRLYPGIRLTNHDDPVSTHFPFDLLVLHTRF